VNSTSRIHFAYIVGILVTVIILLLTVQLGGIRELVGYVTFALTVTSIFLAVLAIVHAFLSNASFLRNVQKLDDAAQGVEQSVVELTKTTTTLTGHLEGFPQLVAGMTASFASSVEPLKLLAEGKAEAVAVPTEASGAGRATSIEADGRAVEALVRQILARSSRNGLMMIYVGVRAHQTNKSFHRLHVTSRVKYLDEGYFMGYMVALSSAGLLEYNAVQPIGVFEIESMQELLVDGIVSELDRRYNRLKIEDVEAGERLLAAKAAIDAYFAGDADARGVIETSPTVAAPKSDGLIVPPAAG